jgi:hypothetical protein
VYGPGGRFEEVMRLTGEPSYIIQAGAVPWQKYPVQFDRS